MRSAKAIRAYGQMLKACAEAAAAALEAGVDGNSIDNALGALGCVVNNADVDGDDGDQEREDDPDPDPSEGIEFSVN